MASGLKKTNDKLSKYQVGENVLIRRSDLKDAIYNPRIIDDDCLKRLKNGIRKHGLIGASIVWNRRTGTVVSGHQRLKALDLLEKGQDYELQVTVIDVPEKEEKELNVQLNNPSMQGDWDLDKLEEMFDKDGLTPDDLGFSQMDMDLMFEGSEKYSKLFEDNSDVKVMKEEVKKIKNARATAMEQYKATGSADYYFTVVCETQEDKSALLREMNLPVSEMYVSSEHVRRLKKVVAKETDAGE
ncbi:MAG: ParB N-terminal domain-containing protein [Pyramidobacter sp.]|uniref:ParB N-terminal domain-containing protein n=1 Tax=Pyramidobacter sp. TaxID=1943581 RepID=UPI0025F0305E|nr:ParB N-terminal domain-containing protein [Pyramidobacter sp.]MCI7403957.1 ParB N-terminal domain-containing protein [Pyramidobacter sp.]